MAPNPLASQRMLSMVPFQHLTTFHMLAPAAPQVDGRGAAAVVAAAFVANVFESWLGATVQGRLTWLTNDLVNVLQIALAAGLAIAFVTVGQ